jgi:NAD(P)H-hydrate repair Nnr-like enzyme with NAD(P)H-hydrate dehydratase domain
MAQLTGLSKETIAADPRSHAARLARQLKVVVLLKGACTIIAAPDGGCWRHAKAIPGLAASGSGDVLAGLVSGLMARGASPAQAACWAVWLHSRAAMTLERRLGPIGYLASELAGEVPRLLRGLAPAKGRRKTRHFVRGQLEPKS